MNTSVTPSSPNRSSINSSAWTASGELVKSALVVSASARYWDEIQPATAIVTTQSPRVIQGRRALAPAKLLVVSLILAPPRFGHVDPLRQAGTPFCDTSIDFRERCHRRESRLVSVGEDEPKECSADQEEDRVRGTQAPPLLDRLPDGRQCHRCGRHRPGGVSPVPSRNEWRGRHRVAEGMAVNG